MPDPDYGRNNSSQEEVVTHEFLEKIQRFSKRYAETEELWRSKLLDFERSGKKVVGWGAGGHGVFFFNALKAGNLIPFVVDINPNRQHMW